MVDIADAVVSQLNAGSFSKAFTATRGYLPRFDLEEMGDLRVTVVPKSVEISTASRSGHQHDYGIDVAIQRKLEQEDAAEIDPLMDLVEEIADQFRGSALPTDPQASCVGVANAPVYAQEHMREDRLFTSVLTLTFRTWRQCFEA
jgi:hypothetical protein